MDQVIIFTKPGCPHCAGAKEDMERRGVRYTEQNVQGDALALARMLALNGNRRHVPTIVQGDQVTVGFRGY